MALDSLQHTWGSRCLGIIPPLVRARQCSRASSYRLEHLKRSVTDGHSYDSSNHVQNKNRVCGGQKNSRAKLKFCIVTTRFGSWKRSFYYCFFSMFILHVYFKTLTTNLLRHGVKAIEAPPSLLLLSNLDSHGLHWPSFKSASSDFPHLTDWISSKSHDVC